MALPLTSQVRADPSVLVVRTTSLSSGCHDTSVTDEVCPKVRAISVTYGSPLINCNINLPSRSRREGCAEVVPTMILSPLLMENEDAVKGWVPSSSTLIVLKGNLEEERELRS